MLFPVESELALVDAVRKRKQRPTGQVRRLIVFLFGRAAQQGDGAVLLAEIIQAGDTAACVRPDFRDGAFVTQYQFSPWRRKSLEIRYDFTPAPVEGYGRVIMTAPSGQRNAPRSAAWR